MPPPIFVVPPHAATFAATVFLVTRRMPPPIFSGAAACSQGLDVLHGTGNILISLFPVRVGQVISHLASTRKSVPKDWVERVAHECAQVSFCVSDGKCSCCSF